MSTLSAVLHMYHLPFQLIKTYTAVHGGLIPMIRIVLRLCNNSSATVVQTDVPNIKSIINGKAREIKITVHSFEKW